MEKKLISLVTGGAGFIGSHLVDALIEKGDDVLVIDNLATGIKENVNPEAKFFEVDIRNLEKIEPIFKNVDFVFHLAALPKIPLSVEKPIETNDVNVNGALNVLVAARNSGVKKLIFSSSSSVYGEQEQLPLKENMVCHPLSPYALQKYAAEFYCKIFSEIYGLATISLRYSSVYGPRQPKEGTYAPVMSVFLEQRKEGKSLTVVGDGKQTRDFTHVFDVVRANLMVAESEKTGRGEIINIAGGKEYTIKEIAEMIGDEIEYIDKRKGEVFRNFVDITKAKEWLDWEPKIKLEEGIKNLLKSL